MCYSYDVSITTFIIGTIFTIINSYSFIKNPLYLCLNLYWFSGVLMQLWEAFLWKNINCKLFSKLAMITNLIQPLVLLLILTIPNYIKENKINIYYVGITSILYLLYILYIAFKQDYGCIREKTYIDLKWWNFFPGAVIYITTTIILLKLLLNERLSSYQIGLYVVSLLIGIFLFSNKFGGNYNNASSKIGSIWCWIAAFIPLINYIIFKYSVKV